MPDKSSKRVGVEEHTESAEQQPGRMLVDVRRVASLLNCSPRTVYRLSDGGRMPRPVKLGGLVRWRRDEIASWICAGCPAIRSRKGGAQ